MKLMFGGIIAVVLLGLYGYSVITAILVATGFTAAAGFTSGFSSTMTTVGGLVAALVVAELALTKPGQTPIARVLQSNPSVGSTTSLKIITFSYLTVWLALGLSAYIVGSMWYPDTQTALADVGQSWLGVAVAAAYAYFEIQPNETHQTALT
jgi:hypothetical protein